MGRLITLILLVLILAGAYFGVRYLEDAKRQSETLPEPIATQGTSTPDAAVPEYVMDLPTATTTVPSTWKKFSDPAFGFSLSYPRDFIVTKSLIAATSTAGTASTTGIAGKAVTATLTLTLPKEKYFSWPLQDDVKISIIASSSCPDMLVEQGPFSATTTFSLNNNEYGVTSGDGAAAGNRYQEIVYDTLSNGRCYHFSLYDHGANGAGLYVSDQSLVQGYDDKHEADLNAVISIFNAIVASFKIL